MRILRIALFLIFALALGSSPAIASTIVVPNNLANTVGNSIDASGGEDGLSFRAQQLFGSGQFVSAGAPLLIDQFAWRTAPGTGPYGLSVDMVDIYASTSARVTNVPGPLLMSTTFADNIGPDNALVYHGPLSLSSPGCAAGPTPCAFDLVFNLQTPFLYNPQAGRLLLDFHLNTLHSGTGGIDEQDYSSFPIPFGPIAGIVALQGDPTADEFFPSGTITQFRYTAVPEPATMTLMLLGLGAGAARWRNRK